MSHSFGIQTRTNELEEVQPLPISITLRSRNKFTESQLQALEREFHTSNNPSKLRRKQIAEALNVTEHRIRIWFQNKRYICGNEQNAHGSSSSTSPRSSTHQPNETTTSLRESHSFGIQSRTNELEEVQPLPISITLRRRNKLLTESQLLALEREFHTGAYPSRLRRIQIAEALKMTEYRIGIWFNNRRTKYRKEQNAHGSSSSTSPGSSTHLPNEETRTSFEAKCDDFRGNPRIFNQSPPPSLSRLSTPANAPTGYNTPLSATLRQLNYGTPCYPTVNSETHHPNTTTTGLKTSVSELGWNSLTNTKHIPTPPLLGVTPASYEPTGYNYNMGEHQDYTLSTTEGQMSYGTAGYPTVNSLTLQSYGCSTVFRTRFNNLGCNPPTCSQYTPPPPPPGVTPASYEPTKYNYDIQGIHQDYTLSPTVGQMSYGTAGDPTVSSPTLQSHATTTGFRTRLSDFVCNPPTCSQYTTFPPPPGVTPASYEPTRYNYDMGIHEDYTLSPTVGQMSYGTPDHPIVNNSTNFLPEDRFSEDVPIEEEYISSTSSVNFTNCSTNNENFIEEYGHY